MRKKLFFYSLFISLIGCLIIKPSEKKPFKPQMVKIKGGTFNFGDFYEGTNTDAIPVHEVFVEDFKISKYEITYAQFDFFSEKNDLEKPKSDIEKRGSFMGNAFKLGTELVAAVAVGTIIGFILDSWFDTKPWLIIIFFFLGAAAGMLNVIRAANKMQKD